MYKNLNQTTLENSVDRNHHSVLLIEPKKLKDIELDYTYKLAQKLISDNNLKMTAREIIDLGKTYRRIYIDVNSHVPLFLVKHTSVDRDFEITQTYLDTLIYGSDHTNNNHKDEIKIDLDMIQNQSDAYKLVEQYKLKIKPLEIWRIRNKFKYVFLDWETHVPIFTLPKKAKSFSEIEPTQSYSEFLVLIEPLEVPKDIDYIPLSTEVFNSDFIQEEVDKILDKINLFGIDSISEGEKQYLNRILPKN